MDRRDAAELVRLRERVEQLESALESRVVIEQAKGVLAERLRIDVHAAFELLRAAARNVQMSIHALARDVVESPVTPAPVTHELVRTRRRRRQSRLYPETEARAPSPTGQAIPVPPSPQ
jgi:hypothetical protein